ncbi:MAG: hypothetical protein ABJO97_18810 [Roseibium sp.]|uniref:hypothetical protein n=1 Tax=Alphaproteobacteria TaxID=28211 RepID=UPI0032970479
MINQTDPVLLNSLFDIPPDTSPWPEQEYQKLSTKSGNPSGRTPVRPRASFISHGQSLTAPFGRNLTTYQDMLGIYILAFTVPEQWFYVGIAAPGRSPEGVLNRIRKHRVKATGSHVGTGASNGGVNHTDRWRVFAPRRYRYFEENRGADSLADAWLITSEPPADQMTKRHLEEVEHSIICNENDCLTSILATIPGWHIDAPVYSLNSRGAPLPAEFL